MTEQLKANVEIRFGATESLAALAKSLPLMPYEPVGTIATELIVQTEVQRWTIKDGNKDTTIIYRADVSREIWDHASKTCYEFEDVPPSVGRATANGLRLTVKQKDHSTHVRLEMTDPTWEPSRHELEFSNRDDLKPFAAAVFHVLHGGSEFHTASGLSIEGLIAHGCLVATRSYLGESTEPAMEMRLTNVTVQHAVASEFVPPKDFRTTKVRVTAPKPDFAKTQPGVSRQDASAATSQTETATRQLLHKPRTAESVDATPDCVGSTRVAPMSLTIHQSLLDNVKSLLNQFVPLLGFGTLTTTTVGATPPDSLGTFTLPWLSALTSLSPTAAGSGLGVFLTDPRLTSTQTGGPSGGQGLLDMLAVWLLENPSPFGNLPGSSESAMDVLLQSWGIVEPLRSQLLADLVAANGDITQIADQDAVITIVQAFENAVLSTITANFVINPTSGIWTLTDPITSQAVPLLSWSLTGVGATVNFATIPPGAFITSLAIGANGDINAAFSLPNTTITATLTSSLTWEGWLAIGTSFGAILEFGLLFPGLAAIAGSLTVLLAFLANNTTPITAVTTGATATFNLQFQESFDTPGFQLVPVVTLTGSTGTTTVSNVWSTPNVIANLFESLATSIGNATNSWLGLALTQVANGLSGALASAGCVFPSGPDGIGAVGGTAVSTASTILELVVLVTPQIGHIAEEAVPFIAQPYITQVDTTENNAFNLLDQHFSLEGDLNPQPINPPPPLFPIPQLDVAMYLGLGLSQNALNVYLFQSWLNGTFEYDTSPDSDPSALAPILAAFPTQAFQDLANAGTQVGYLHVWCATPPRVEVSMDGIIFGTPTNGNRPLVFYFDDVRICFEPQPPTPNLATPSTADATKWELSFNATTTGTLTLQAPFGFNFAMDTDTNSIQPIDATTWEFINPFVALNPTIMAQLAQGSLQAGAMLAFQQLITPMSASSIAPPAPPINVSMNAVPGSATTSTNFALMQQSLLSPVPSSSVNQFVLLMLAQRRTLYLLTAFQTQALEFVDGSGAKDLNSDLGTQPGTFSLGTFPAAVPGNSQFAMQGRDRMITVLGSTLDPYIVPALGFSAINLSNSLASIFDVYYSVGAATASNIPIYFDIIPANGSFMINFSDLDGGNENGQSIFLYVSNYGQPPGPTNPPSTSPPTVILSTGPALALSIPFPQ